MVWDWRTTTAGWSSQMCKEGHRASSAEEIVFLTSVFSPFSLIKIFQVGGINMRSADKESAVKVLNQFGASQDEVNETISTHLTDPTGGHPRGVVVAPLDTGPAEVYKTMWRKCYRNIGRSTGRRSPGGRLDTGD